MTNNKMDEKIFELTPSAFVYGGNVMARLPDGRAVFVPFALPGEKVRLRLVDEKRGFARAELMEVLQPMPGRIAPRCQHFGQCGQCHYQHMTYADQLTAKQAILRDQLERVGKLSNPPVNRVVASPEEWNYSSQMVFKLDPDGRLGFSAQQPGKTLAIQACHLPVNAINALWPQLEFEPDTAVEQIHLSCGAEDELMLVMESPNPEIPEMEIEAGISVAHLSGEHSVVLAGEDNLLVIVLGRPFRISPGVPMRANHAVTESLLRYLLARLPLHPDSTVIDAYCGAGILGASIAPYVGRLIGIESNPQACEDYAVNLDEFESVELYEAPVEIALPGIDANPSVILLDPPATGLAPRALDGVVSCGAGMIAYVSSDPSTLARDAGRLLAAGYKLVEVQPFDFHPHTSHIDCVALFEK